MRDGPGGDPTSLDVTIAGELYDLSFRVYDHSDLALLGSIGYGGVSAYDDATVSFLHAIGYATGVAAHGRSTVVAGSMGSASATDDASLVFSGPDSFSGSGRASISCPGTIYDAVLSESATMHMTSGTFGFDSGQVGDDAYLLVDGTASVLNAYGFQVTGNARVDIHSGELRDLGSSGIGVSDFGLLQLFGGAGRSTGCRWASATSSSRPARRRVPAGSPAWSNPATRSTSASA